VTPSLRSPARIFKLLGYGYIFYLIVFLWGYDPTDRTVSPPFVLFVLDTINLFIHEAGHFFFGLFPRWLYILGGSFLQCFLPLLLLILTWVKSPSQISLPGFWFAENLINVSFYVRDAPYMRLRLIARGVIHDWNWLLADNLDAAEPLSNIFFGVGLLLSLSFVAWGVVVLFRNNDNSSLEEVPSHV